MNLIAWFCFFFFTLLSSSLSVLLPPTFSAAMSPYSFELCYLPCKINLPPSLCKASSSRSSEDWGELKDTAEIPRALAAESYSWKEQGGLAGVIPACRSHTHSCTLQFPRLGCGTLGVISDPTVCPASPHCCSFSMSLAGEQGEGDTRCHRVIIAFAAHI